MTVYSELRGAGVVKERLGPQDVSRSRDRLLHDVAAFGHREAVQGARGLGGVPGSLTPAVQGLTASVISRHPGAFPGEVGRRPGARIPPLAAIAGWAARHGLEGLAFPIARAIARRGIKGRFFMRHARERLVNYEVPRLVDRSKREIAEAWGRR